MGPPTARECVENRVTAFADPWIELDHLGPHALRHACANRLLQKGSSLQEIADFLGHRNTKSVGIYAKCDMSALRKVAAFRLAGLR